MRQHNRISSTEIAATAADLGIRDIEKQLSNMLLPDNVTGCWLGAAPTLSTSTTGTTSTWTLAGGSGFVLIKNMGIFQYANQSYVGNNTTSYPKYYLRSVASSARIDKKNRSHNLLSTNSLIIAPASSGFTQLAELTGITSAYFQYANTAMNRRQNEKTVADFWYLYQSANAWHEMNFSDFYDRNYGTPSFVICSLNITAEATLPTKITWRANDHSTSTKQVVDVFRRAGESYVSQHLIPIDSTGKAQYYCSDSAAYNPPTLGEITVMGVI
jgi:hypothetical protein